MTRTKQNRLPDLTRFQLLIIRDEYTCQDCGAKGGPEGEAELHVHHITPVSDGGSDALANLETLCRHCHLEEHRGATPREILTLFSLARHPIFTIHQVGYRFEQNHKTIGKKLRQLNEQEKLSREKLGLKLIYYQDGLDLSAVEFDSHDRMFFSGSLVDAPPTKAADGPENWPVRYQEHQELIPYALK